MQVTRCQYLVYTDKPKQNGQSLSPEDVMNIGYMAGRFGINLGGNLQANSKPKHTNKGTIIDINSCTADLFQQTLQTEGIKFDKIA